MKYILFEQSAIDILIGMSEFQSIEFPMGKALIDYIVSDDADFNNSLVFAEKNDTGIIFSGKSATNNIIVFDLVQSALLEQVTDEASLLLIIQKTLRTAIKIWNRYPFSSSERVNRTKSIVFPFVFSDKRRVVIERSTKCDRLIKRGIDHALLVYNYTDKDPHKDEEPSNEVLRIAGETYLKIRSNIINSFSSTLIESSSSEKPLLYANTEQLLSSGDFMYLDYSKRIEKLTTTQRNVVENTNIVSPIRIEGPAGTGKTASMILRAFYILEMMRSKNEPYRIIFLSHSESTNIENKNAFSYISKSEKYLDGTHSQHICFTTLLNYCIDMIKITDSQVIDRDALDAKKMQRVFIEEALDKVLLEKHKTYRALLSDNLNSLLDEHKTPKGVLLSMLQHEFSVQIKGRTDGTIEEYYKIDSIKNALVLSSKKDKEFIFEIFKEYQNMLSNAAVYDLDDITVAALSMLNAPIWRRERKDQGYDYIFVDEMHLFNINEQYCFHYFTKSPEQKEIPICFALDYSQAIGDRGNIEQDLIEKQFAHAEENNYNTVFRSSQQITDFCAAISAAGALMFQSDYRNPYTTAVSGFTEREEKMCKPPELYSYDNDVEMINSLKGHIANCQNDFKCKSSDIAIISFEDSLFDNDKLSELEKNMNKKIRLIKSRYDSSTAIERNENDILLFDPNSVNGLEFKCVILVGVDEGRVPQSIGVSDISENYLKFAAFNQLYLVASRAKYRLILTENKLHGHSSCLKYALEQNLLSEGSA